jgi:hypothetical protein
MWGLRPDLHYCQTVAGFPMRGILSDERTGLSFAIVTGPRQRSHSRIRVPWDPRPYFTLSDSILPFSSPPTTRRATVKVFDPASTRDSQTATVSLNSINRLVFVTHMQSVSHVVVTEYLNTSYMNFRLHRIKAHALKI